MALMHSKETKSSMAPRLFSTTTVAVPALLVCAFLASCKLQSSNCNESETDCLYLNDGHSLGHPCAKDRECRSGLICQDASCQAPGTFAAGEPCELTAECTAGLYCDHTRQCATAGSAEVNESCAGTVDCTAGLQCGLAANLVDRICTPRGLGDLNDACEQAADCAAGLHCIPSGNQSHCQSLRTTDVLGEIPPLSGWPGVACPEEADGALSYFHIPTPDDTAALRRDFYRLPFPNDLRRTTDNTLDLEGHPFPPIDQGFPTPARVITQLSAAPFPGFSPTPVLYFRFSQALPSNDDGLLQDYVAVVDVTPDSPTYGREHSIELHTAGQSKYICGAFLAVRIPPATPLRRNTTYAALLRKGLPSGSGQRYRQSTAFSALLNSEPASDSATDQKAHASYAPLRDYLDDQGLERGELLNATVFSTAQGTTTLVALTEAVQAQPLPTPVPESLTLCDDGVISPCETSEPAGQLHFPLTGTSTSATGPLTRGACSTTQAGLRVLHGQLRLPMFQDGEPPFLTTGGQLATTDSGQIQSVGTAPVCFALAVPDGPMPEQGYPLLIHAHGTGGSFTDAFAPNGVAAALAQSDAKAAVLAIDMPQHGSRRGTGIDSALDPMLLLHNISNPQAMRGNHLQGAADLQALIRWATESTLDASRAAADLNAIRFDSGRMALIGHDQGASHAALMLPFDRHIRAFVLSGLGGHLTSLLLHKTLPVAPGNVFGTLLADPALAELTVNAQPLADGTFNPLLALLQTYLDAADPLTYAPQLYRAPPTNYLGTSHIFMTYGLDDSYTPDENQSAYAVAAGLPQVRPLLTPLATTDVLPPAVETIDAQGIPRTLGVRQYRPETSADGHFVATTSDGEASADVLRFLEHALSGETPLIGERTLPQ